MTIKLEDLYSIGDYAEIDGIRVRVEEIKIKRGNQVYYNAYWFNEGVIQTAEFHHDEFPKRKHKAYECNP